MGDAYWNHQASLNQSSGLLKRPRPDYDLPPSTLPLANQMHNHLARNDDHGDPRFVKDTQLVGSAYDRYLQSGQLAPYTSGEGYDYRGTGLGRTGVGSMPSHPVAAGHPGIVGPDPASNGRAMGLGGELPVDAMPRPRDPPRLPPDATNTLYVEGLPPDSTKREVAHIFRPFVGYKEVRLVRKEPKYRDGDTLILCFVDFIDAACATTALSALQGYKMDEHDPHSAYLRLQFSKYPGPRSGSGTRGKR